MSKFAPLFASERSAAGMLDMRPAEFRALVQAGALPEPIRIGPHERWSVVDLDAIVRGHKPKPPEEFSL
ncbi:hypothetical protein [Xinfangfangia pollutisoli]|uniref:hypothetical protein n=1 Tax=Xinfangfangia pollutisoli TaxID=2865960 RepID=UPI001CD1A66D|nr:hypothetical protein [Xinfangfangia pollutisoli]